MTTATPPTAVSKTRLDDSILKHARTEFVMLRHSDTVQQALETMRGTALSDRIVYFYVSDAAGKLVGVVPTRRLLMSDADQRIQDIMIGGVVSVPSSATVGQVCEAFVRHRFLAIPVVDDAGAMVGVADVGLFTDDLQAAISRRADSDVFQLIGLHVEAGRPASPFAGFRTRFPWLLCNIGGGLACALVAAMYEDLLAAAVVVSLFVPVVLALAESVSIQSMTLTLQSLHGAKPAWGKLVPALAKEAVTALLLGLACGSIVGAVAWIWRGQGGVSVAIAVSIGLSMLAACMLGVALPTVVRALRGDPKIAAGPIVLATTDIVTLLAFFNLAGWFVANHA